MLLITKNESVEKKCQKKGCENRTKKLDYQVSSFVPPLNGKKVVKKTQNRPIIVKIWVCELFAFLIQLRVAVVANVELRVRVGVVHIQTVNVHGNIQLAIPAIEVVLFFSLHWPGA